jgi:ATP-dependent exoDNAse (exonuclease V) beta subunit
VGPFLRQAAEALERLRAHPVMAPFLDPPAAARVSHEVPVSLRGVDGEIVRGTIDCVVERADGAIDVIEFKTGQRRDAHRGQLSLYVSAAQALFPTAVVHGHLVYASDEPATFR